MNTNEIIIKAKERLAEIETEAARLRAIITAAEGKAHAPQIQTVPVFVPYVVPQPMPYERHTPSIPWVDGSFCNPDAFTICGTTVKLDTTIRFGGEQTFDPNVRYALS